MGLSDVIVELMLIFIFAVLGIMYLSGKCSFLIPKYKYLSEDMKKRTDTKKLCRLFGLSSLFASLSIGVMITGGLLKIHFLFFLGIVMLGADIFCLFNKGNKSENFLLPKDESASSSHSPQSECGSANIKGKDDKSGNS